MCPLLLGEEPWLALDVWCGEAHSLIGERGGNPSARRSCDIALLHQEGFYHVFHSVARFRQRGRQGVGADRPAGIGLYQGGEVAPVQRVEAVFVDLKA